MKSENLKTIVWTAVLAWSLLFLLIVISIAAKVVTR